MKRVVLLMLAAGSTGFFSTGCATPAYTPAERNAMIARNWNYEIKMASDDWDSILLLRPASRLTIWNVR